MVQVSLPGPLHGTAVLPGSKPHGQRAVVLASLSDGTSTLHDVNLCAETLILLNACRALGAAIEMSGTRLRITGVFGRPGRPAQVLQAAGSGLAARVLLAVSCLGDGPAVLTGSQRVAERPLGPLFSLLRDLGARLDPICPPAFLPAVSWGGGLDGGTVTVPMADTSQFATALLLAAPYARGPVTVLLDPCGIGQEYVTVTADMMAAFGATLTVGKTATGELPDRVTVRPGGYTARDLSIGPDATVLFCLIAAGVGAEAEFTLGWPAGTSSGWGDDPLVAAALDIGRRLGMRLTPAAAGLRVAGWQPPRAPVHVDAIAVPTFIPALAAVAARLPYGVRVTGARHLQFHKTDRLALLLSELGKLGHRFKPVMQSGELDGFETAAPGPASGAELDSHGDHRLFCALVLAALASPDPVVVRGEQTLAASFPGFLRCLAGLGVSVRSSGLPDARAMAAGS